MGVPIPPPFYVKAALFIKAFISANWLKIALVAGQYAYARHQRKVLERLANQGLAASYSGSVDYSSIVLGERMIDIGTRVWSNSGPDSKYITEVVALMNQGRGGIEGVTKVFIDNEEYVYPDDFEQSGDRWRLKEMSAPNSPWRGDNLLLKFYYGDQTTADSVLNNSNLRTGAYKSTNIGKGIVYVVRELLAETVKTEGNPDLRYQIRGYKCHDPRVAGSSYGDPTKWVWTDNPVIQAAYVQTEFVNDGTDERVDWAKVAEYANYCDELVEFNPYSDDEAIRQIGVHQINQIPTETGAEFDAVPVVESGVYLERDDQDTRLVSFTAGSTDGTILAGWLTEGTGRMTRVTLRAKSLAATVTLTTDKLTSEILDKMRLKFERTITTNTFTIDVPIADWGDPETTQDAQGNNLYTYTPAFKNRVVQGQRLNNYQVLDDEFFNDIVRTNDANTRTNATTVSLYVASPSALEKRFRSDVYVPGNTAPAEILNQLEISCDGNYIKFHDTGKWALEPAMPGTSTLEVEEKNLAQYPSLVSSDEANERFTEIAAAYVDKGKQWKRTETPPLKSPALKGREGRDLPREEIAMDAVVRFSQCWRLLVRQANRQFMQETITLGMYWDGLELIYGTRFDFASPLLSIDSAKKFRAERINVTGDDVPVVVEAREDADWIYEDIGWQDYPYFDEDDVLVLPRQEGPALGSLTATGEVRSIRLDWTAPAFGEIGNVQVHSSDAANWDHPSRGLAGTAGLGATSLTISAVPGATKYFWAFNIVDNNQSARFPSDDVTPISATATAPGAGRVVKAIGSAICPPDEEWVEGSIWIDPETGKIFRAPPDPFVGIGQPGTIASGVVTYDVSATIDLNGEDISWQPRSPGIPDIGLLNVLLAVRGTANVTGTRRGALFALTSGIGIFAPTDNNAAIGFVIGQRIPDILFSDAVNAVLNSIDVNFTASNATIVFRDDNFSSYGPGPHLLSPGGNYTMVVRIGTVSYALPIDTGDVDDPYLASTVPAAFLTACRSLQTQRQAGTPLPDIAVAMVDETQWRESENWGRVFTEETTQQTATFVTTYSGTDSTQPFSWPIVGLVPDFVDGAVTVVFMSSAGRCFTPNELSRWVEVPDVAEEVIWAASEEDELTVSQQPSSSWALFQIENQSVDLDGVLWSDNLEASGFSSRKPYGWHAVRQLPVDENSWVVTLRSHWGQSSAMGAVSRRVYGARAASTVDGGWRFLDGTTDQLGVWDDIKSANFLELSPRDSDNWLVTELEQVETGDVLVFEPESARFQSYAVTSIADIPTGGKRFGVVASDRYADGDGSDITATEVDFYFQRFPLPKPQTVSDFLYNSYGNEDGVFGEFKFTAGGTDLPYVRANLFKQIVNQADAVVLAPPRFGGQRSEAEHHRGGERSVVRVHFGWIQGVRCLADNGRFRSGSRRRIHADSRRSSHLQERDHRLPAFHFRCLLRLHAVRGTRCVFDVGHHRTAARFSCRRQPPGCQVHCPRRSIPGGRPALWNWWTGSSWRVTAIRSATETTGDTR